MNIWHLSESDLLGGAARAAYRIHRALHAAGVDSRMHVARARSGDPRVRGATTKLEKLVHLGRLEFEPLLMRLMQTANPVQHSAAVLPSQWPDRIARSDADLVHLHWMGSMMLSVADIALVRRPLIWTLHDMWAFCGAEHYATDERWQTGYTADNRPAGETGLDLNRWTWNRKRRHWKRPIQIVTPSRWLADCVRQSALMADWPVEVIPNALDTEAWSPINPQTARHLLGLPSTGPLLLFGAYDGAADPRKGFDLLAKALARLRGQAPAPRLIVIGQTEPEAAPDLGYPIHYCGQLNDDLSLRVIYSAADAMLIPSRQDNLPNSGVESLACGTPVIAFNIGGLPDIVDHKQTGWLARPFDTEDLAQGIRWVLGDNERQTHLRVQARAKAVSCFSSSVVTGQYQTIYERLIEQFR